VLANDETDDLLCEEDDYANCEERDRPGNLAEVQHDRAFHRFLHAFHSHGYDSTVLSGKLSKVSRFVRFAC
jgi:hypothetical protein